MSDQNEAPVRTPERPMAFVWKEFRRGVIAALLTFHLLFLPLTALVSLVALIAESGLAALATVPGIGMILLYAAIFQCFGGIPVSIVAAAAGGLVAYGLGSLLTRVARVSVHIALFGLLGAAVGAVVVPFLDPLLGIDNGVFSIASPIVAVPLIALSGFSVSYGWWWTASRALSHPEEGPPSP